ncbi:hypothetical protein [Streptomyces sp. XH2]|uniref:hypothetical protein n=1 Tax=Streptomyces sp. XH2 TaxID=3412483 RepID=UPI003C7AF822
MSELVPPPPDYPPAIGPPRPPAAAPRLTPWWQQQRPETLPFVDEPLMETPQPVPCSGDCADDSGYEEEEERPVWFIPAPGYYPAVPTPAPPAALSPRARAALYNLTAAGAGYGLGLTPLISDAITAVGHTSISGALVLGGGTCLATAHFWDRRTRHWWCGLAWAARIPLASAVLALALYAPAATT